MDPIPLWLRRLWDAWDLRALVLLSFTLQIILSIFGDRRKYISSMWINVLVWSAYLMADWVATVALGKLSDVQGSLEKSNSLWAIWAPLLLLHLGGPNSITAYSLEDNQLWLRHLLGLLVQISAAIYVILMSWKNSWFSFMSLPALVAGVIKYGERTWVLKAVSDDKYLHWRPFGSLRDKYSTEGHDYVRVLVVAYERLHLFMGYLVDGGLGLGPVDVYGGPGLGPVDNVDGGIGLGPVDVDGGPGLGPVDDVDGGIGIGPVDDDWGNMEDNILRDALEVKTGLMYDLLYTKAAVIYSKGGFIMRCISFGCTVIVLVGLTIQILHLKTKEEDDGHVKENWHEMDIAITVVLTVGAVALEIYAAIEIFSSNWIMLWLIKQGRGEWVIWLSQRFPWLFNREKKYWSQMMGQFDLLGYCLKHTEPDVQISPSRKLIRSVLGHNYEVKWDKSLHKTVYFVHPPVYNAILEYFHKPWIGSSISDSLIRELDGIWAIVGDPNMPGSFLFIVKWVHLATEICYHLELEWDAGHHFGSDPMTLWMENREASKALSDYMMYLLVMHPSLLPNVGSLFPLERDLSNPRRLAGDARDVNEACHYLLRHEEEYIIRMIAEHLKGKEKQKRWEIIKLIWLRMLQAAAHGPNGFTQKDGHFQKLRQGGELLTLIWFINPSQPPIQSPSDLPPPMRPSDDLPPPMRQPGDRRPPMPPPFQPPGNRRPARPPPGNLPPPMRQPDNRRPPRPPPGDWRPPMQSFSQDSQWMLENN
ncbi:hypothetical protein RHSIM_Rhsim01G0022600 [Rhododendron simsii]|uniref:DUF4220 domain-containing protein n=1 Tax=Rhododendron simsii TaxID=118357 RepID=A0A834HFF1_RHOSS|nr:hypothetical protein RHSIM_Rhsim01G0022600 [Rhododendron simsii]